jgi:hypothetical protein
VIDSVEEKVESVASDVKDKVATAVDKAGDLVEKVLPGDGEDESDGAESEQT